ncbi:hypothetical protein Cantr_04365 [Candida viswanathii]|uniref:Asparagine synthetase domain-containing protein n=1 Tax=Candida viswanathii TaxID=5486 RepID=A0A367XN19_9ASCO|nr:hypothetical protein Cantr_04365 [Candida viswanathii]
MCGILLKVFKGLTEVPSCIPQPLHTLDEKYQQWETLDQRTIQTFLDHGSKLSPLTQQQVYKLENLPLLRELNNELLKIKNNVKADPVVKQQQRDEIQRQIDAISKEEEVVMEKDDMDGLIYNVSTRGPDYSNYTQFTHAGYTFQSFLAILSLRQPFTRQPIIKDEFILQFNGELYNDECLNGNDTQFIIDKSHENLLDGSRNDAILKTLKYLDGEFAIILVDLVDDKVYFGRDSVGKRSLCYELTDEELIISSVSTVGFVDCKNEIYEYDLVTHSVTNHVLHDLPTYKPNDYTEEELVRQLYGQLKQSVFKRQDAIHPLDEEESDTSKLAVLFSGGLDCTIVAALICELLSKNPNSATIDLLTVGFENPRTNQKSGDGPDRQLALKSWFHLSKQFPRVNLQLIEVNVDYRSWFEHKQRVKSLMFPYNTEMDFSIAIAFYFASSYLPDLTTKVILSDKNVSWDEFIHDPTRHTTREPGYESRAKVLFSGLGADELFAGYSRHEAIFSSNKAIDNDDALYDELQESLNYDISIIHQRNLSRDDRVVSCWGKEMRYPYLDVEFINWVITNIPPQSKLKYTYIPHAKKKDKVVFTSVRKHILRQLAEYLSMPYVAQELKRAIQFGAKSAKLHIGDSKVKGTDSL